MCPDCNPFDDVAAEYDAWFESESGRAIFALEVECLKRVMPTSTGRWLEVGVGTGRFAAALAVTDGTDPSDAMRACAEQRGIHTINGRGECLPYPGRTFDGVLMTTTLCFLADPAESFQECCRVLKETGHLIVGLIPADSPWGQLYAHKAAEGHRIYSAATFYRSDEVVSLAVRSGFRLQDAWSCLLSPPESLVDAEQPRAGIVPGAGFVAMAFMVSVERSSRHGEPQ